LRYLIIILIYICVHEKTYIHAFRINKTIILNFIFHHERIMMFEEPIATSEKYIINLNHIYHRITRSFMSWFLKFARDPCFDILLQVWSGITLYWTLQATISSSYVWMGSWCLVIISFGHMVLISGFNRWLVFDEDCIYLIN
jgi:hypothetical protein